MLGNKLRSQHGANKDEQIRADGHIHARQKNAKKDVPVSMRGVLLHK